MTSRAFSLAGTCDLKRQVAPAYCWWSIVVSASLDISNLLPCLKDGDGRVDTHRHIHRLRQSLRRDEAMVRAVMLFRLSKSSFRRQDVRAPVYGSQYLQADFYIMIFFSR